MTTRATPASSSDALSELRTGRNDLSQVLAFFDSLPSVQVEEMVGLWRGDGLLTGNAFDGLLESFGWYGKRFAGADDARPLVFRDAKGLFELNPSHLPLPFVMAHSRSLHRPGLARAARSLLRLQRTTRPQARLRMIEYRGVATATMAYDAQPINDHFRRVDQETVVGLMDVRGQADHPFAFVLTRVEEEGKS